MPWVGGAQWFLQVRSPKSAEEFRFTLDLPDGETLRADEASGGVALERDGRAVGAILAPSARDAQGRPVEVSYAVEGKTVVVKVAHRGLDVVYPLVVDPEVRPGFDWRCAGGPCSGDAAAAGWAAGSQGGPYTAQGGPYFTVCGFNPGLCLRSNPGSFTGTASAWWSYASIRQSYVYRAYFGSIHLTAADAQECVQVGILNGYFWQGTTFRCSYSQNNWFYTACVDSQCRPGYGAEGNAAIAVYSKYGSARTQSGYGWGLSQVAEVRMSDRNNPTLTATPASGTWVNGNATVDATGAAPTVALSGHDGGLGIWDFQVRSDPTTNATVYSGDQPEGCDGSRAAICPTDAAHDVPVDLHSLPEGQNTLTLRARDVIEQGGDATWVARIDKTGPAVSPSLSGTLWDRRDQAIGDTGTYTLTASATDGDAASGATQRSGVTRLEVLVDGTAIPSTQASATQPCSSSPWSCGMTATLKVRGADLGEGQHTIAVRATDAVGNQTAAAGRPQFKVTVHHSDSTELGPGEVNLSSGELTVGGSDVSVAGGAGASLSVSRSYASMHLTSTQSGSGQAASPFGRGWQADLPTDQPGADWVEVDDGFYENDQGQIVYGATLLGEDGDNVTFLYASQDAGHYYFTSPAEASDLTLVRDKPSGGDPGRFVLTDTDRNQTTFMQGGPNAWLAESTKTPGGGGSGKATTVSYVWDRTRQTPRITKAIAPNPTSDNCNVALASLPSSCRVLVYNYANANTTGPTTGEGDWGNYPERLQSVELWACTPSADGAACSAAGATTVQQYLYDRDGRLRAAWDPRVSPALKTRYGYDANGLLTSIAPPGLNAWTVTYDGAQQGRVSSVSRPSPQGTLSWSVAYGVALSGSGLPDVSAGTAATGWGQSDTADLPDPNVPGGGTAIFPPGHSPGSGYDGATIRYLDVAGRVVNTAPSRPGSDGRSRPASTTATTTSCAPCPRRTAGGCSPTRARSPCWTRG